MQPLNPEPKPLKEKRQPKEEPRMTPNPSEPNMTSECNYFGICPRCDQDNPGEQSMLNIERDHWYYCDEHKTKWCVGSNLFSVWRQESEADWAFSIAYLDDFETVEPCLCRCGCCDPLPQLIDDGDIPF